MSGPPDDDLVPISVRLGEVVPPEDPEDWTKPLTWVAAGGMLLGPIVAAAWFILAPPEASQPAAAGTLLLASALAGGAVLTGATQQGRLRAWAATVASALFGALVVIVIGVATAGERQVGSASPTVAHAFGGAVAGLAGATVASLASAALAGTEARWPRILAPGVTAVVVAVLLVRSLMGMRLP